MITFNNDPALKALAVARAEAHVANEELLQGTYGQDIEGLGWKACSLGCHVKDIYPDVIGSGSVFSHGAPEAVVGLAYSLPSWVTNLQEKFFEREEDMADARAFHVDLLKAIPYGVEIPGGIGFNDRHMQPFADMTKEEVFAYFASITPPEQLP